MTTEFSNDKSSTHHSLGLAALRANRVQASLVQFKAALELDLQSEQYWVSYLDALIQAGQIQGAQQVFLQAKQFGVRSDVLTPLELRLAALVASVAALEPTVLEMNQLAMLFGQRSYSEALEVAKRMAERFPKSGFAWKALGAAYKQLGLNQEAVEPMLKATVASPLDPEAHSNLGATLHELGRYEDAVISLRQAVVLKSNYAEAYNNLGNSLRKLEQNDEALACYQSAIQYKSDYAEAYSNLGIVLRAMGRLVEAQESYQRAIALRPNFAEAHNNLGLVLQDMGMRDAAEAKYRNAIEFYPTFSQAHYNLGLLLLEAGGFYAAEYEFLSALRETPQYAEALSNLGIALQNTYRIEAAKATYLQAIVIDPSLSHAHINLGTVLMELGQLDDARASYAKAAELGIHGAKVRSAFLLPPIMGTLGDVLETRQQFESNLDALMADATPVPDPLKSVGATNFYLAYHGLNDRDLQVKVARYFERVCPSLCYTSEHCNGVEPRSGGKTRIGFFSRHLSKHAVSFCFSKVIETFAANADYEVTMISHRAIDKSVYADYAGNTLHVPYHLEHARDNITALKLDILVYLDIGMDPMSYFLAFARLAPVQCVLGGHPVTTGIGNLDYFISSELMESASAQDHYSEKLVRMPTPLFYFERPPTPPAFKTRAELGLPLVERLYICPMRLQKLHPEFDEAMGLILQGDPQGVVVLFEDALLPFGKDLLIQRFAKTVPSDVRDRIIFTPWLNEPHDFMSAIAAADVILDPFHFGIGSTSALTSVTGTPIVTRRGELMRGRVGAAYCEMLDISECVATDAAQYVGMAISIASDADLRQRISERMLRNNKVFYENMNPIHDLVEFFSGLQK